MSRLREIYNQGMRNIKFSSDQIAVMGFQIDAQ